MSGTQVYIKTTGGSDNLQRWGEGTSNNADSYRFRIDQNFNFIANTGTSGGGDNFIVRSATGKVGIGTTTTSNAQLELIGTDPNDNVSRIANIRDNRSFAANVGGGISFFGKYNSSGDYSTFAHIVAGKTNATDGDYSGYLSFKTRSSSALPAERMRIDSNGNVGIGGAPASDSGLHLQGDGKRILIDSDDYNLVSLGRRSSSGAGLDKAYFRMRHGSTNTVVIDTDGDSYFNGGNVVIGGTTQQGGGLLTLEGPDAAMLTLHRTADTGDQEILFYDHGDHNATIIGKTGGDLQFRTNGRNSVAMHLKSDGNVGIGTTNPNATLHVDPAPNVTTSFGSPLIKVGGDNSWGGNGSIYSIGFGYVDSSVPTKSPAEIGLLTTDNSGHTKGALVFATRNVDTNTAPSERMRIHSDGEVTMPSQPAFRVDQTYLSGRGTNYYLVDFSDTQTNCFDIGNNFNNNIFTAPVDGVYFFSCSVRVDSVSGYFRVYISKNSSTDTNTNLHAIVGNGISTDYENLQVSGTLYLSENDTARVYIYSNSDSNWTSQGEGHFSGFLVG